MASDSTKPELFKGSLRPTKHQTVVPSYTQKPASKNEVFIVDRNKKHGVEAVEFNSRAIPQPFLDSTIIPLRQLAEQQWQKDQQRAKQAASEPS